MATLDVVAKTTDGSRAEGIAAPRLTGDQVKAGDLQYGTSQKGVIVYCTSPVSGPTVKTINITREGYYYFDGAIWQKIINGNNFVRVYSTVNHQQGVLSKHGGNFTFISSIPETRDWQFRIGRGESGDCSGSGLTLSPLATAVIIYRIGSQI